MMTGDTGEFPDSNYEKEASGADVNGSAVGGERGTRARSTVAFQAALEGAELVGEWDAPEGGWSIRLRDPGARLAAAGFEVALQALSADGSSSALTPEDLTVDGDGQFTSERFGRLAETLVAAELNLASDLLESMALAFEVAFESGARRALAEAADQ